MIHAISSKVHDFPIVCFFSGKQIATSSSEYFFDESKWIFGIQNLASHLLEYDGRDTTLLSALGSEDCRLMIENLKVGPKADRRPTLVNVKLEANLGHEVEVRYFGRSLSEIAIDCARDVLTRSLGRGARVLQLAEKESPYPPAMLQKFHACEIAIRTRFVAENHGVLSERYHLQFSKDLYVDSQVPFIMLPPVFSGCSDRI